MRKLILAAVVEYIGDIDDKTIRGKIRAQFDALADGFTASLRIKTLRGKVKELIIKQHRFIFFIENDAVYIIHAFKKQGQKTPRKEIEHAERLRKGIMEQVNKL